MPNNDFRDTPSQGAGAQRPPTRMPDRAYYPSHMEIPPNLEMAMRQGSNAMIGGIPHWMDDAGQVFTYWNNIPDRSEDMYASDPYYGSGWTVSSDYGGNNYQSYPSSLQGRSVYQDINEWNRRRRGGSNG